MRVRLLVITAALAATGGVALATMTGPARNCTLADAQPGVIVVPDGPAPAAWASVVLCRGESCSESNREAGDGFSVPFDLPDEGRVTLRVRVNGPAGPVADDELNVLAEPYSPNGEGCGPTVGRVGLAVGAGGDIRQVPVTQALDRG